MRRFLFILLLTSISLYSQNGNIIHNTIIDSNLVLSPESQQKLVNQMVTQILSRYHYKKINLNDSLSAAILNNYIKSYDNGKLYFLKSDIEDFQKYKNSLDDFLVIGKLDAAFEIFNRYVKELKQRVLFINNLLKHEFDYTKDESYKPDRKDTDWAKTKEELDEVWRKRLKWEALQKKLNGDSWETIKKALKRRYHNYQKIILQYKPEDVFQLYLNAFAEVFDPHTDYLSPKISEQFDINMNLSLEGIGASLRVVDDYTTIVEAITGGPAYKSKNLHPDDKIIAVAQGDSLEFVDVIGWRLDDTVQLIRGKKGTVVRLKVLRAGKNTSSIPEIVRLTRDKVKLEERAASKEITTIKENGIDYKIGIIKIPTFYLDFAARARGEKDFKSTTRDVHKLINELKKEKIDGLIIDLRNNTGGALPEAIELTGLFIDKGPVVQIKYAQNKIEVENDPNPGIIYGGPLAVVVNKISASASEIFAGAIQDYKRGIIIGEQTFGKGTVQNLIDLKKFIPISDKNKLGKLKLTMAKFYRITGESTQRKGVIPDIEFPSLLKISGYGESSQTNALPWDKIPSSTFSYCGKIKNILPILKKEHEERTKDNKYFKYILEDIEDYKIEKDKKIFSLQESIVKKEKEKAEKKKKEREEIKTEKKNKDKKDDDAFLDESEHILSNFIFQLRKEGN